MLMENLARSPSGFWYPTQVRRKTSNLDSEQIWKYFLDFETPIPDDLFLTAEMTTPLKRAPPKHAIGLRTCPKQRPGFESDRNIVVGTRRVS